MSLITDLLKVCLIWYDDLDQARLRDTKYRALVLSRLVSSIIQTVETFTKEEE